LNILTFDIEDWFNILGHPANNDIANWSAYDSNLTANISTILELLQTHNQKATFFCLGWLAANRPELLRMIADCGFEIGSHTYAHKRIYEYKPNEFRQDVERSIKTIEDVLGKKVKSFRFPGFFVDKDYLWAFEILTSLGIEIDSSVKLDYRNTRKTEKSYPVLMEINERRLKEFPLPRFSVFDQTLFCPGSGYFRFYPYSFSRKFMEKNAYNLIYFHPRDFDVLPQHEKNFNLFRNFKNNVGKRKAMVKFAMLFSEFKFVDIQSANSKFDWGQCRLFSHHYKKE
jgi:polysaccharide deacetylase family protein (PEP-CTERM system associated)